MEDIKWKDGEVCYADGVVWKASPHNSNCVLWEINTGHSLKCRQEWFSEVVKYKDFQLNEVNEGDYIKSHKKDTEEGYNKLVIALEDYGFDCSRDSGFEQGYDYTFISERTGIDMCTKDLFKINCTGKELSSSQLMAIGKLKRAMNETVCGKSRTDFVKAIDKVKELESEPPLNTSEFNIIEESRNKRNKSKQAYVILESLDYNYDTDKQQWYQRVYV